jgi:predicted signal transduction protein with EAL and GGDEF domain
VKLDKSLIASIGITARSFAIAQSVIGLCRQLGLEVTAEGIEEPAQLKCLLPEGNLTLQGFLISRPVSEDQVPRTLDGMGIRVSALLQQVRDATAPAGVRAKRSGTVRELRRKARPA